jgi:hypothetical protein
MLELSSPQSKSVPQPAARPEGPPLAAVIPPARTPTLLSRVGKYALIVGGVCAAIGALEGAIVGAILAQRQDRGTVVQLMAFDRGILLGLLGAAFGAVVGVFDHYLGSGRKRH